MSKLTTIAFGVTCALFVTLSGCSKSSATGIGLPELTPPVKAAAPAGLQSRNLLRSPADLTLDAAEFKSRFFAAGPTYIFDILTGIDSRITEINTRSASSTAACLTQSPVEYTITPWGQTVTMYGQCYEILSGATAQDPKLIQFGVKDGVTYLYVAVGAAWVAAKATLVTGSTTDYTVDAWMGVGYTNQGGTCGGGTWDGCSYGVLQIKADSQASTFEMAVSGLGFGFCGAQLKSDGTNVYGTGSTDMGATCNSVDTLCKLASDMTTAGDCTALTTFDIPAMGRVAATSSGATGTIPATWGASTYPASPSPAVTLDGTSTDSMYFGPVTPTTGLGLFQ